tara:strand:- start:3603 stop:3863 length:261 start_codon:yes stop_codon:yes gene_type:complete
MTRDEIDSFVDMAAPGESLYVPDGLDGAFMGVTSHVNPPAAVYSIQKCVDILSESMTRDEALDHVYYNVIGGCPAPSAPIFIDEPN